MVRAVVLCLWLSACSTGAIDSYTYLQTITKTPTAGPTADARAIVATFPLHVDPQGDGGAVDSASPVDAPSQWTYRHQGAVTLIQGVVTNRQDAWSGLSVKAMGRNQTQLTIDNTPIPTGTVPHGGQTPIALAVANPRRERLDLQIQLVRGP
jgi:hypothetical protein